jgi:tRNA(fMet)-specific endonuclease VapC
MSAIVRRGGGPTKLARLMSTIPAGEQFTTAVTVGELLYGARKRGSGLLEQEIDRVLAGGVDVLPFDEGAARHHAEIKVQLEAEGRPIGEPDLRIAATCRAHDVTLITGNVRHFERVPGLRVENWLE